jgi:hypothetical protein
VQIVLSIAAAFSASSLSVERAYQDEDAEDDYDEGPKDGPEVSDVPRFLEKKSQADYYDYYAENYACYHAAVG